MPLLPLAAGDARRVSGDDEPNPTYRGPRCKSGCNHEGEDEGIEDGMTFQGEPLDSRGFDRFFVMVAIVISAAFMIVQISGL